MLLRRVTVRGVWELEESLRWFPTWEAYGFGRSFEEFSDRLTSSYSSLEPRRLLLSVEAETDATRLQDVSLIDVP